MLIAGILEECPNTRIMLLEPFVLEGMFTAATEKEPERWDRFRTEVAKRAAATKRIAEKYHLPFVALQDIFDDACKRTPASYWLRDGVHPTSMGHWLIKDAWIKAFREAWTIEKY